MTRRGSPRARAAGPLRPDPLRHVAVPVSCEKVGQVPSILVDAKRRASGVKDVVLVLVACLVESPSIGAPDATFDERSADRPADVGAVKIAREACPFGPSLARELEGDGSPHILCSLEEVTRRQTGRPRRGTRT